MKIIKGIFITGIIIGGAVLLTKLFAPDFFNTAVASLNSLIK